MIHQLLLYNRYKRHSLSPGDIRYTIKHWRESLNETELFYKYYDEDENGNGSGRKIDFKEVAKYECLEMVYAQFVPHYGKPKSCLIFIVKSQ